MDSDLAAKLEKLKEHMTKHGIAEQTLDSVFNDPRLTLHENISEKFENAAERRTDSGEKGYEWYKKIINITEKKEIAARLLIEDRNFLEKLESKYGRPKEVFAAIYSLESSGGQNKGSYDAFSSLVSQYLYTDRKGFAQRELIELWDFSSRTKYSVFIPSSFAGAVGGMQAIPSSLNAYAIDSEDDLEKLDLFDKFDNYCFIANYLSNEGMGKDLDSAIFTYNHSKSYVRAVREIADHADLELQKFLDSSAADRDSIDYIND